MVAPVMWGENYWLLISSAVDLCLTQDHSFLVSGNLTLLFLPTGTAVPLLQEQKLQPVHCVLHWTGDCGDTVSIL